MARASPLRVRLRRAAITAMSRTHLALYRVSGGRLLGSVAGMPVLLLTTTGRHSRLPRTTPLTFFRDGDDLVVIGSNGGADRAPNWLLNLREHPQAVVTIGTERLQVTAATAAPAERERLWPSITAAHAGYAGYQERTLRPIPVVLLSPLRDMAPADDAGSRLLP